MRRRSSPNHDARPLDAPVDILVLHYTGMKTAEAALDRLCDPDAEVSAHYVVEEDGTVWSLVDEARRAWHAGRSFWRGATNVNARSVGIEVVNPGHEFGYRPFPEVQMAAVVSLASEIVARHRIPARNVVGHSDVAPTRKLDPGERFDWQRLASAGVGLWPGESTDAPTDPNNVIDLLSRYGWDTSEPVAAVRAFQRHFRPWHVTGQSDVETARRLHGLIGIMDRATVL